MTAPEHNPLPWHDDGYGITDISDVPAHIYGEHTNEPANRRLIIRAVNSHDALLAAAKKAFTAIDLRDGFLDTRIDLQAAIAAAEEPAP